MMAKNMLIRVLALLYLFTANEAVKAQQENADLGAELLLPFKQNLQKALIEGLAQGTVEAISACNLLAPEITENLSQEGIRLGRSSHLLRNTDNTAPEWVLPILEAYETEPLERTAATVSLNDSHIGYVEPIMVQPLCLNCHGKNLGSEIATRIGELYPHDRATGYSSGDFRGVFWIEYPAN